MSAIPALSAAHQDEAALQRPPRWLRLAGPEEWCNGAPCVDRTVSPLGGRGRGGLHTRSQRRTPAYPQRQRPSG